MTKDLRDRIAATIVANPEANIIAVHISDALEILRALTALRSIELIAKQQEAIK